MLSCKFEVSSYRYDTESKISFVAAYTDIAPRPVSLLIARGAADDLNMHRWFLGPKLLTNLQVALLNNIFYLKFANKYSMQLCNQQESYQAAFATNARDDLRDR